MNTTNHFDILGQIISLIISDNFTASVTTLSQVCNIPVPQMRKYLSIIFENKILLTHLSPTAQPEDNDITSDPLQTARTFLEKIRSGQADHASIYLIDMDDFLEDYHLLPVTSVEVGYINSIYPELIRNQRISLFETKDTVNSISDRILEKQDKIQNAISQKKKIEFHYQAPQFDSTKIICSPVTVIQNLTTHTLYLKDTEKNYYRLDRIKSNIRILQEISDIDNYQPDPYQRYFWGTESKDSGEPVHVKLRILAETSNIIEKLKNDTRLRNETGHWYQDNKFYYYEDDILGLQDFRRWIRSYGSSITVLEPQTLIDKIIDNASTTLEYYRKLKD